MSEMAQRPLVQLKSGAVRGRTGSGVAAFLGVPYAAPPFGVNRMKPPQPVPPWDGAVADRMHQVWVDFITSGDPGWPAYDTTRRTTGLLAGTITVADDPSAGERACWDGIR